MKRNILGIVAITVATVACCAALTKKNKNLHRKSVTDTTDEDIAILKILKQSDDAEEFATKYAKWSLGCKHLSAIADSIYLTAVRDSGIYSSDVFLVRSVVYFAIGRHREVIEDKFGDINVILDLVLKNLSEYPCDEYGYYNSLTEAVILGRVLPLFEEVLHDSAKEQNVDMYESALTSYLLMLAEYDSIKYIAIRDKLVTYLESKVKGPMTFEELSLCHLLDERPERFRRIIQEIDSQLNLNS